MLTLLQRVSRAEVRVEGTTVGAIGRGAVLLVGVERGDGTADADETARKVAALRFFPGRTPMDRTLAEAGGSVLVVSQFTLAGDCRKGRRPSFDGAAAPEVARPLYEDVVNDLRGSGLSVGTGEFQATMHVALVNDGPVTLLLDSRKRF